MIATIRTIFLLLLLIPSSWLLITKMNKAIKNAKTSYASAEYEKSVADHLILISDFEMDSPEVQFNLGLSYMNNEQREEAQRTFTGLISSKNKYIASFSFNHNGILLAQDQQFEEALEAFKFSLIKDPSNEAARYNYELLARWMEENPDQDQQDQEGENDENQDDQEDQDQEDQDQDQNQDKSDENKKDGEGDEQTNEDEASKSEQKEDKDGQQSQDESDNQESNLDSDLSDREKAKEQLKERLKEMNLTPEQAAQILEAMNAAELRYIQQNRKNPTKRPERGLPEW
ncbi:hypothetical protein MM239_03710 [Belliella sp. DSM 111904]|uniref:Tetratricopeptide repeat-containing protein n=1 Tax=Belliella filtrata TaxID=2923435 RepID=A0ABS9UX28_9BACT|nr:hypothetical protein [Belliella filtrata]MCH7408489.1 hypothetical protein [Belliella filtrata]